MKVVTYTFRGTTRLGAMHGEREVVDLARASENAGLRIAMTCWRFCATASRSLFLARSGRSADRVARSGSAEKRTQTS